MRLSATVSRDVHAAAERVVLAQHVLIGRYYERAVQAEHQGRWLLTYLAPLTLPTSGVPVSPSANPDGFRLGRKGNNRRPLAGAKHELSRHAWQPRRYPSPG